MIELEKPENKPSLIKEIIIFLIIAVCVVLPFRVFIAEPYIVSGESMFPTFDTGHYLIVDKISYKFKNPQRFDVVVMIYPEDVSKDFLKRIIGLPNETVVIKDGKVTIKNDSNQEGFILEENYIQMPKMENLSKQLGKDEYFVMGDNREGSFDSRYWGSLPRKDIIGKPLVRILPFQKFSFFPGNIY